MTKKKDEEVVEKKVKRSTAIRRKQQALAAELQAWRQERAVAAEKRSKEAAEARRLEPRGKHRVPAELVGNDKPITRSVSVTVDDNYFMRRATAKRFGTRNELGKWTKAPLRAGSNRPYINPDRKQRSR